MGLFRWKSNQNAVGQCCSSLCHMLASTTGLQPLLLNLAPLTYLFSWHPKKVWKLNEELNKTWCMSQYISESNWVRLLGMSRIISEWIFWQESIVHSGNVTLLSLQLVPHVKSNYYRYLPVITRFDRQRTSSMPGKWVSGWPLSRLAIPPNPVLSNSTGDLEMFLYDCLGLRIWKAHIWLALMNITYSFAKP